ncbi:hypothetical protein N7537_002032 [Penicillium hordei]|uniref:Uncharacterized protein n=1 Tax=Penicillium hordei TaxID=40994 RepID=A0AAD6H7G9_9EURO|nr:uncharacterized protein N7537_002032 [Penicillium hordei]KAJ5616918.1 hypothetical protein N7537_002032 [Penicillium hordei]
MESERKAWFCGSYPSEAVTNNYNVTLRQHSVMTLLYVSVPRIHVSVERFSNYISKYMYREEYKKVLNTIAKNPTAIIPKEQRNKETKE